MHYNAMTGKEPKRTRIPLTEFDIDADHTCINACPEHHNLTRTAFHEGTISAHFDLDTCKNCSRLEQCPVKLQKKDAVIRVSQKTILADVTRLKLADGGQKEVISLRAAIEGTNSALKRG